MPTPEVAEAAPWWAQYAAGVTAFGSLVGIFFNGFRASRKPAQEPAKSLVLDNANLADLKPLIEVLMRIVRATEDARDDTHEILTLARKEATNEEIERLAEERADRIVARRRAEYEDSVQEAVGRAISKIPPGK